MQRLSVEIALVFALLACTGCGERVAPDAAAPAPATTTGATPPTPPPPPTTPRTDDGAARAAALAKGPGTCEEDVTSLRVLPANGQLGRDPHFDRMAVHPQAYAACLVAMVRDRTPMQDPGDGPKRTPYDQGTLAYDLLHQLGHIEFGECVPADVVKKSKNDVAAIAAWLDDKNHRRQAHRCLAKGLGL